jgi:hypothetical protein
MEKRVVNAKLMTLLVSNGPIIGSQQIKIHGSNAQIQWHTFARPSGVTDCYLGDKDSKIVCHGRTKIALVIKSVVETQSLAMHLTPKYLP